MDRSKIQKDLNDLYDGWKRSLTFTESENRNLKPPCLLSVTEEYCNSSKRIMVFGQETGPWGGNRKFRKCMPKYPRDWEFQDIETMQAFIADQDAITALCWLYREFAPEEDGRARFASRAPKGNTPFWRAFREVQGWPGVGVMWNNVSKWANDDHESRASSSILRVPESTLRKICFSQIDLFKEEIRILQPHACIFFTGPNYDNILKASFPGVDLLACSNVPVRKLASVSHPTGILPVSFRTYHPRFLNYSDEGWGYIAQIGGMLSRAGILAVTPDGSNSAGRSDGRPEP